MKEAASARVRKADGAVKAGAAAKHASKASDRIHVETRHTAAHRNARHIKPRNPLAGILRKLRRRLAMLNLRRKGADRPRRPVNRENVKTALWLWCFPVGASLMWRPSCTWKKGVKIGVTAAMVAALVAVFVVPVPVIDGGDSGVQMIADRQVVEVYGPALPNLIVPGYTTESTGSIIVDEVQSDVHYVYAADDARCYHEYECKFAFASSQRLTVYEAYYLGFDPCGRCNPPVYTPGVTDPVTAQPISSVPDAPAAEDIAA